MIPNASRRTFLKGTAGAGLGLATLLSPLELGLAMRRDRKRERSAENRSREYWPDD